MGIGFGIVFILGVLSCIPEEMSGLIIDIHKIYKILNNLQC